MANEEHLTILAEGIDAWNKWRQDNRTIIPDLSKADLSRLRLDKIDLSGANLYRINLRGAILTYGNLEGSDLRESDLLGAIISGARLQRADLSKANLIETNFNQSNLRGTNLAYTILYETNFGNADLSGAIGLELCQHIRASTIDHRTIIKSDSLPVVFLRGCGLPDFIIDNIAALKGNAIQLHSCFISHSSKDEEFANRVYADLQNKGVRCWFAPKDMKIGEQIRTAIDHAIHLHDKLLLILSQTSVDSQWVEGEVEKALERERKEKRAILFPIRIDNTIFQIEAGWANYIKNTRNIGDFTSWRDHTAYLNAFRRLLRDLAAPEGGSRGSV